MLDYWAVLVVEMWRYQVKTLTVSVWSGMKVEFAVVLRSGGVEPDEVPCEIDQPLSPPRALSPGATRGLTPLP